MSKQHTNALINETSPYLLQHAHNPVNWEPWSDAVLNRAKTENKLLIVSIGYSACHWCHVMEHESFENENVAAVMNASYIPIKIDREERPDIDAIYMSAIQLMTGQGGWPLNVVLLPDGLPVWGGTYFPKENWIDALQQIAKIYQENPVKLRDYAERLEKGLSETSVIVPPKQKVEYDKETIAQYVAQWSRNFDPTLGGMQHAPKFMMPTNIEFLLRYTFHSKDNKLADYVHTTLRQMAYGGIYDQVGGGFSRYSTDKKWHVPHFEKMLYDNAQLLSLYSKAYRLRKDAAYKETVFGTIAFLKRELRDNTGAFYAALDADSMTTDQKLEEGAYYVWRENEIDELIIKDPKLFKSYYNINDYGHWEHGKYVLIRDKDDGAFAKAHGIDLQKLRTIKKTWQSNLLKHRQKRQAPRLDDKLLTCWNGLTITGLLEAYKTFGKREFLSLAQQTADFILKHQLKENGSLYRNHKNGKSTINAYLEDFAAVIEAFISLFEITTEFKWLAYAKKLTVYVQQHFKNSENGLFYFTSVEDPALIIRTVEYQDNVIPSSNSMMAKNLFKLGHLLTDQDLIKSAEACLHSVQEELPRYPSGYANWMDLMLNFLFPFQEISIIGKNAVHLLNDLSSRYIPNAVIAATHSPNVAIDLFKSRWKDNSDLIYVCNNNSCERPVDSIENVLTLLEKINDN